MADWAAAEIRRICGLSGAVQNDHDLALGATERPSYSQVLALPLDTCSHFSKVRGSALELQWTERYAAHQTGSGVLVFQDKIGVGVDWVLVQTGAGSLFLLVRANGTTPLGTSDLEILLQLEPQARLHGKCTDGSLWQAATAGRTGSVYAGLESDWLTMRVNHAESRIPDKTPVAYRLPITNLCLDDPPCESWQVDGAHLLVDPVADYDRVVSTLYTRDRQAVCAILTIRTPDLSQAIELASTFCELASYACGCRVAWLHAQGVDASNAIASNWLTNAITGQFVRLPLIEESRLWSFIQDTWDTYTEFRTSKVLQSRRLLGMLMNATATDDFLELRGLKLAGTVDALVTIAVVHKPEKLFASHSRKRAFMTATRKCLTTEAEKFLLPDAPDAPGRRKAWAHQIASRASDVLRPTFRELIESLCATIDVDVDAEHIKRFVTCRNDLVHEARFVCQGPSPPASWPFSQPADEYFWILGFVDRLILRTLGYRGPYLDRCMRDSGIVGAEPLRDSTTKTTNCDGAASTLDAPSQARGNEQPDISGPE